MKHAICITKFVHAACRAFTLVLFLLALSPMAAQASNVHFVGIAGYNYQGTTAVLTAQRVENFDALGASGFLRLELWAFPTAYSGGSLDGYKLAQHIFGPLSAGSFVENVNSGPVAFVPPPPGTWVLAMVLTEYSGLHHVNDGFVLRDWFTFVAPVVIGPADAGVIEFHNVILDHYFLTDDAGEAAGIDLGSAGPGWVRTGYGFNSGGNVSVCRFYGSVSPGPNSHFFTADEGECAYLRQLQATTPASLPRWNFEEYDFASTPTLNGLCPSPLVPVYRAYNNGLARGIDSNHRIGTSLAAMQQVVARGWTLEGIVMCAPQ